MSIPWISSSGLGYDAVVRYVDKLATLDLGFWDAALVRRALFSLLQAAEDADKGRSASCLNRRWRSTGSKGTVVAGWGLALHATACRGEAGMSEEALDCSEENCCRDVWNASRAHSSLSSRPSLLVSPHSVASAAVGVGLRTWSRGAAAGVRS